MEGTAFRVFHLDTARGPRFCVHHPAADGRPRRGALLYVHAFAEEMNKSRRMAAVSARAFAAQGFEVLQIDLLGCGDSPGDFADATWADWLHDVREGCRWLRERTGASPWLWGLRAGCLVALEAARAEMADGGPPPAGFLFWQPPGSGKLVAQQFLRLRVAAEALRAASQAKDDAHAWASARTNTAPAKGIAASEKGEATSATGPAGETEVAGYRLSPALLSGLQQALMTAPAAPAPSAWLEVTSRQPPELLPGTQRHVADWSAAGQAVTARALEGPGFWQTQEVLVVPALLQASIDWLDEVAPAGSALRATSTSSVAPASSTSSTSAFAQRARHEPTTRERGIVFQGQGDHLVGVLTEPAGTASGDLGMLIVVGGPQYRAGSHRQFVNAARMAAAAGLPALRFDCRGMGDSEGAQREFDEMDDDIAAALDALVREAPAVRRVVVFALCDAASATLLYLRRRGPDSRVAGLVLMNPWVRTLAGQAATRVRHYYVERLRSADFWRKLLSGRVARGAFKDAVSAVRTALGARSPQPSPPAGPAAAAAHATAAPGTPGTSSITVSQEGGTPSGNPQFIQVMAEGCQRYTGPLLLVTSGRDYTAKEFLLACTKDARWREVLARPSTRHVELPTADHTFSTSSDERELLRHCHGWLQGLHTA